MMSERETMTMNLSAREMAVLRDLGEQMDMSKTAVMRSALRLFQLVHVRAQAGEHLMFSGDQARIVEFIGPGFGDPA
jgi:hypothetical protein